MAKTKNPKPSKADEKLGDSPETNVTDEVKQEAAETISKAKTGATRGPRGVAEDAKITLTSTSNPKRTGSKAERAFGHYATGMTVKEFADVLDADPELKGTSTGHLTYDAKHGFITIDGYDPGKIVEPKPRAVKAPKAPKTAKVKGSDEAPSEGEVQAQAEAQAEQME